MKERPILFSTPMVQAILDESKTQTRRVVKKDPDVTITDNGAFMVWGTCPYGKVGDLLWVRETWRPIAWDSVRYGFKIEFKDEASICTNLFEDFDKDWDFELKCADIMHKKGVEYDTEIDHDIEAWTSELIKKHMPWRPSIHMPKAAARIWLEITDVRVERLQDISTVDIKKEGVRIPITKEGKILWELTGKYPTYRLADELAKSTGKRHDDLAMFVHWAKLWMEINGEDSWNANPWVWVVGFKLVSTTGKP